MSRGTRKAGSKVVTVKLRGRAHHRSMGPVPQTLRRQVYVVLTDEKGERKKRLGWMDWEEGDE